MAFKTAAGITRESHSHSEKEVNPASVTSLKYEVAMTDVKDKPVPEENEGLYGECSMATLENTYAALEKTKLQQETEQVYMNADNTAGKGEEKVLKMRGKSHHKTLACLLLSIVAMAIVLISSIAYFSAEIDRLKTQTSSLQQSPFGQEGNSSLTLQLLQQIQQNVSDATNHILHRLNNSYQQLVHNISVVENRAELLNLNAGLLVQQPASSCAALLPTTPSGYYWVSASNGSAVHVYCEMTRSCGGVTGGWVRVGYLDMTNSSHQCPSGFTEHNDSNIRTCRRTDTSNGCVSVMMDVPYQYSRVCGRVRAYQVGDTDAFRNTNENIDSKYVDGVSLTHGLPPRQHIWTFAAGRHENSSEDITSLCPCTNNNATRPPAFVETDYFCESGIRTRVAHFQAGPTFFPADPLWDGQGCADTSTCCSFNTPPWFHKQLSQPATDDIEMRVCRNNRIGEDVAIEIVEIYVQ